MKHACGQNGNYRVDFSKWHLIKNANFISGKGYQNKYFAREKSTRFSMGERGTWKMQNEKYRDELKNAQEDGRFARLLIRKKRMLGQPLINQEDINNRDHPADEFTRAALSTIQTMAFALNHKRTRQLKRVEDAIVRLRRGTYGLCVVCDESIEEKRLKAVPETEFCLFCKQILERQTYGYGTS